MRHLDIQPKVQVTTLALQVSLLSAISPNGTLGTHNKEANEVW